MTTKNASDFISQHPSLREEVERILRLRAWKDETFRQELTADPKGTIEQLFPECFPNGKIPEQMTYKVIEEDQYTKHIILPTLPDNFFASEVPEEAQLILAAKMRCDDMTVSPHVSDFMSSLPPLREEVERTLRLWAWKDETFRQELIADPKSVSERLFPECFPDGKVPEQVTYKVIEEDQYTKYIILPALPDELLDPEISEDVQLELIANMGCKDVTYTNGCDSSSRSGCNIRGASDSDRPNSPGDGDTRRRPLDLVRGPSGKQDSNHESEQPVSPEPSPKRPYDLFRDRARQKEANS